MRIKTLGDDDGADGVDVERAAQFADIARMQQLDAVVVEQNARDVAERVDFTEERGGLRCGVGYALESASNSAESTTAPAATR